MAELNELTINGSNYTFEDDVARQLITQTNANFANYYTKAESYSASEVDTLLRTQRQGQFVVVNTLPSPSADTMFKIYLAPSVEPETQNVKDEFVTLESNGTYSWEKIGTTAIDLSGYSTTEEMNAAIANALASYYTKSEVDNAVKNMVAESGVYDVSANNDNTKFESLSALLVSANLNTLIPTDIRKGGMSIKFVQSSDNKYIRYNLIADEFTTDVTKWAIADGGVYVDNPEFVYVKTDNEGKILWAIRTDGSIYYGAGVPTQIIDYINEKIVAFLDEYEDIVAFLDDLEKGDKTLQELLSKKVDGEYVDNPEFIEAKTDKNGKVLEATRNDGTKILPKGISISGSITEVVENPEWVKVIVDKLNRIIFGISRNNEVYFNNVALQKLQDEVSSLKTQVDALIPETYKDVSDEQVQEFCNRVLNEATPDTKIFVTLTDSHTCGNYETSEINNNATKHAQMAVRVAEKVGATALVHLGDAVNDGSSADINKKRLANYMGFQRDTYIPFLYALGHHEMYPWLGRYNAETRTFINGNDFSLPREDVNPLTLKYAKGVGKVVDTGNAFNYYCDFDGLRCIFVDTCYCKWGVTTETVDWVESVLDDSLSNNKKVVVFAHVPPIDRAFWTFHQPFNSCDNLDYNRYVGVFNQFVSNGGTILAYIHGHTHWDNVIRSGEEGTLFDIYSITSCINMAIITPEIEAAVGGHPKNALRIPGTMDEYAFDVICVDESINSIKFFRFGAGEDRDNTTNNNN